MRAGRKMAFPARKSNRRGVGWRLHLLAGPRARLNFMMHKMMHKLHLHLGLRLFALASLMSTGTSIGLSTMLWTVFAPVEGYAQAQESRTLGVVTKFDAETRRMTVKTDKGDEVQVSLDPRATFRRVAPGETNLANASAFAISDLHAGDRVLARGRPAAEAGTLNALQVIVMSQADIANKQAREHADWDRRGVTGTVTEVAADHVAIRIRTLAGTETMAITPATDAVIRRYAPDSVKFEQAQASKLNEIKVGDQVRARGDKAADNSKMTAEEIVSGAFRTIVGVIISVDAGGNSIRVNDLQTKKQMTVKVSADSSLKKLDTQFAMMIAMRLRGRPDAAGMPGGRGSFAGAGGGPGGPGGATPAGAGPPNADSRGGMSGRSGEGRGGFSGAGGPGSEGRGSPGAPAGEGRAGFGGRGSGGFGGGRGGPGGDLQAVIDRTPSITLADLKTGDAIVVSSTVGASTDQVTAITLVAGVEPILTRPGSGEMSLGEWNMGGDLGGLGGFGQ